MGSLVILAASSALSAISSIKSALAVIGQADGLRGRGQDLVFPGFQGQMVGAAVFGRLLKEPLSKAQP